MTSEHHEWEVPGVSWRRRLTMVGLWLVVVAACASLTWLVIQRAGRDIGVAQVPVPSARPTSTAMPARPPASSTPTASPPEAGSDDQGGGAASRTLAPSGAAPSSEAGDTSSPTSAPTTSVTRSFATSGGTVTAQCVSGSVRLVSATPRDGYRLSEERADSGGLDVSFVSGGSQGGTDGERDGEDSFDLVLVCANGIPVQRH